MLQGREGFVWDVRDLGVVAESPVAVGNDTRLWHKTGLAALRPLPVSLVEAQQHFGLVGWEFRITVTPRAQNSGVQSF